ncbi:MAG TPA: phosphatase PAP2 family protein [Burkholderiales bacterium]|nr:phosphatase PAP2 family protein [Burkholderiales bacterium]
MKRWPTLQAAGLALAALGIWLLARSGLDFRISALAYSAEARGFPLKDAWLFAILGHSALKYFAVGLWCALLVAAAWPRWRRPALHAWLGMALAAFAVAGLRELSAHSCPWDLIEFGGAAQWFPVLGEVPAAPGPGRCLPAAHASTGFALFALYFALRDEQPRLARWALAAAWVLGLTAAAVQVARGAHFASHALWTAWISWGLNLVLYGLVRRLKRPA